jgi:hypothetical protein
MWLDLVQPVLLLLGIEHVRIVPGIVAFNSFDFYDYPWSHSLLMALVWSALFAAVAILRRLRRADGARARGDGLQPWVLDYVTHGPDMPLWPSGTTRRTWLVEQCAGHYLRQATMFAVALAV